MRGIATTAYKFVLLGAILKQMVLYLQTANAVTLGGKSNYEI